MAGQPEATLRWTAPATRRYSFVVGGSAGARAIVALRDGGCGGTELACAEHEVSVDLAMGQSVVIVIEGVGCLELTSADRDHRGLALPIEQAADLLTAIPALRDRLSTLRALSGISR